MACFSEFESTEALIEVWEADDDCYEFSDVERRILAWANAGCHFGTATIEVRETARDMEARRLVKVREDGNGIQFIETPAGARAAMRAFMSPEEISNEYLRKARYREKALF